MFEQSDTNCGLNKLRRWRTLAGGPALAGLAATLLGRLLPAPLLFCPPPPPPLEDCPWLALWLAAGGGAATAGGQFLSTSLCHLTLT